MKDELEFLTITEVADIFRVHIHTVRRWDYKGLLTPERVGVNGKKRLYRMSDIEAFAKKYRRGEKIPATTRG